MEKRRARRRRLRLDVRLEPGAVRSTTGNVGARGVYLRTGRVLKPGTRVRLIFELAQGPTWAEGVVRWAKLVPPSLLAEERGGMGVELVKASPELHAYLGRAMTAAP